jgi:hypothetical protein
VGENKKAAELKLAERLKKGEHDLVFPSTTGTPMDAVNMLKNVFYPALRRPVLPKIRSHDLRHTNASLRIEAGQNMKYIQEQLGHSSIQVTLDFYGHLLRSSNQEAAVHLRATVFNGGPKRDGSKKVAGSLSGRVAEAQLIDLSGGPSGARTPNLLIKSQLLYQLS